MGLINEKDRKNLEAVLGKMENQVKLVFFSQEMECQFCEATRQIVNELREISPKISLEVFDFVKDKEKVDSYKIDKIPAVVVEGKKDHGIRFYGIPAGYEFTTLIEDILDVGMGKHDLPEDLVKRLDAVKEPVRIQVLISPT